MASLRRAVLAALESEEPWNDAIDGRLQAFKRKLRLYKSILDVDPALLVNGAHAASSLCKRATKKGLGGMMAYADRRRRIPKKLIRQIADRLRKGSRREFGRP